ncbi:hypothetical protein HYU95_00620 [Candidatus Daviesbacteria bacterium]|nr:hypothetical protein [Candidatus Daviesbacteria bacterium]
MIATVETISQKEDQKTNFPSMLKARKRLSTELIGKFNPNKLQYALSGVEATYTIYISDLPLSRSAERNRTTVFKVFQKLGRLARDCAIKATEGSDTRNMEKFKRISDKYENLCTDLEAMTQRLWDWRTASFIQEPPQVPK